LRYFFYISYKGTNYHGWQVQPNALTIQEEVDKALKVLYGEPVETIGSGRTDTGVHAKMQVFHVDLPEKYSFKELLHKLNGLLPHDIVVNRIRPVVETAHARFSATERGYEYHMNFKKTPFGKDEAYFLPNNPDPELINQGCELLLGEHDFTSFSRVKTDVNNFRCTIYRAEWNQSTEQAVFHVMANRFLRGMVRAMVGTLLDLGFGKMNLADYKAVLEAKNRSAAGQSVPPQGLYLCHVRYPEEIFIKP
jgi:tRNA pseudouridine38-40 synthase